MRYPGVGVMVDPDVEHTDPIAVHRGHIEIVTSVAWSPDGNLLAGSAADGRVAVWSPRRGVPGRPLAALDLLTRESPATAVTWDPAGRLLAGWADATVVAHVPEPH
jgi:WD40 repeat protein